MNFPEYAAQKGLHLLKDDIKFIRARLHKVPQNARKSIMLRYIEIWLSTMRREPNVILRENMGRREANKYLLTVI